MKEKKEHWSGCHALLQGIFPNQGSNLGLLHSSCLLYHLSHQGSPTREVPLLQTENTYVHFRGFWRLLTIK